MDIVLDMDDTLITVIDHGNEDGVPLYVDNQYQHTIFVRNGLKKFLDWCEKMFDNIYLCTYSSKHRAEAVVNQLCIDRYFKEIIAKEDIDRSVCENSVGIPLDDFVLVDDFDYKSQLISNKMAYFGVNTEIPFEICRRHVRIEPLIESYLTKNMMGFYHVQKKIEQHF